VREATGSVHGEHDVFYWAPVRPGDRLQWQATVHSAHSNRGGVITTHRILVSDEAGTPLLEHLWSNFHIRGVIDEDFGPPLPDHTLPESSRSRPFGTRAVTIDRDQAWRYAGVSNDHAPHAVDEEQAHREGYPTKILQGMCTFGLAAGAVVDLAAGGDPTRLRRVAGRFSAPAFPKKDLVVQMFDAGRTEEGGRSLAFEALQEGVAVIKHGRVDLLPD
jgi:acyl dehydratase